MQYVSTARMRIREKWETTTIHLPVNERGFKPALSLASCTLSNTACHASVNTCTHVDIQHISWWSKKQSSICLIPLLWSATKMGTFKCRMLNSKILPTTWHILQSADRTHDSALCGHQQCTSTPPELCCSMQIADIPPLQSNSVVELRWLDLHESNSGLFQFHKVFNPSSVCEFMFLCSGWC